MADEPTDLCFERRGKAAVLRLADLPAQRPSMKFWLVVVLGVGLVALLLAVPNTRPRVIHLLISWWQFALMGGVVALSLAYQTLFDAFTRRATIWVTAGRVRYRERAVFLFSSTSVKLTDIRRVQAIRASIDDAGEASDKVGEANTGGNSGGFAGGTWGDTCGDTCGGTSGDTSGGTGLVLLRWSDEPVLLCLIPDDAVDGAAVGEALADEINRQLSQRTDAAAVERVVTFGVSDADELPDPLADDLAADGAGAGGVGIEDEFGDEFLRQPPGSRAVLDAEGNDVRVTLPRSRTISPESLKVAALLITVCLALAGSFWLLAEDDLWQLTAAVLFVGTLSIAGLLGITALFGQREIVFDVTPELLRIRYPTGLRTREKLWTRSELHNVYFQPKTDAKSQHLVIETIKRKRTALFHGHDAAELLWVVNLIRATMNITRDPNDDEGHTLAARTLAWLMDRLSWRKGRR